MKNLVLAFLLITASASTELVPTFGIDPSTEAYQRIPGPGGAAASGGGSPTFTGQTCHGGAGSTTLALPCSASMTVSTGDTIVAGGSIGDTAGTLISCTTSSGTAIITWANVATATPVGGDPGNNEILGTCIGTVTTGGTIVPLMTWSVAGGDASIVAAAYSGSTTHATDGTAGHLNTGSTATNGNTSGTITTTTNNDLIVGIVADTAGQSATITAGTTSVTFTKRICTGTGPGDWGGQTCLEDGAQTTAAAGTAANWTFSTTDVSIATVLAVKP